MVLSRARDYSIEKSNFEQIIKLLIDAGADVNQNCSFDRAKQSLLHFAVSENASDVTKFLLSVGADVTKLNQAGHPAIPINLLTDPNWRQLLIEHYAQIGYYKKLEPLNLKDNLLSLINNQDIQFMHYCLDY